MGILRNLFGKKQWVAPQKRDLVVADGHVEKRVMDRLVSMLRDPISPCRNAAMEALGAMGDERAVQPLISALRAEDQDIGGNFSKGFHALAAIDTPDSINYLESFSRDEGVSTLNRREASEVLKERQRPRQETPVTDGELMADLKKSAAKEFAAKDLPALLAILQDKSMDERLRVLSPYEIITRGDTATEAVLPLLNHDDDYVREEAAWIVGELRATSAVDPLIAVLRNDSDLKVVATAAYALGEIGDARAVDPLIQGLGADDADTRLSCAKGLALLGEIAVEPLLGALLSDDWKTKLGAIYSFRGWGSQPPPPLRDPRATDELIRIVGDSREHQYVVANACQALGTIGDRRVIGALAGRLRDNDAKIREYAARALAEYFNLYKQATSKPEVR